MATKKCKEFAERVYHKWGLSDMGKEKGVCRANLAGHFSLFIFCFCPTNFMPG
jgi:hypothetical protein